MKWKKITNREKCTSNFQNVLALILYNNIEFLNDFQVRDIFSKDKINLQVFYIGNILRGSYVPFRSFYDDFTINERVELLPL